MYLVVSLLSKKDYIYHTLSTKIFPYNLKLSYYFERILIMSEESSHTGIMRVDIGALYD